MNLPSFKKADYRFNHDHFGVIQSSFWHKQNEGNEVKTILVRLPGYLPIVKWENVEASTNIEQNTVWCYFKNEKVHRVYSPDGIFLYELGNEIGNSIPIYEKSTQAFSSYYIFNSETRVPSIVSRLTGKINNLPAINDTQKGVLSIDEDIYCVTNRIEKYITSNLEYYSSSNGDLLFARNYDNFISEHQIKRPFPGHLIKAKETVFIYRMNYQNGFAYLGISKTNGDVLWMYPLPPSFAWRGEFMHFLTQKQLTILDPRTGERLVQDVSNEFIANNLKYWGRNLQITEDNWLLFAACSPEEDDGLYPPKSIWGFNLHDYSLHRLIGNELLTEGNIMTNYEYKDGRLFIPLKTPQGYLDAVTTIWQRTDLL